MARLVFDPQDLDQVRDGVPAVTGTIHATEHITTGQRIRVDGSAGTVELIG